MRSYVGRALPVPPRFTPEELDAIAGLATAAGCSFDEVAGWLQKLRAGADPLVVGARLRALGVSEGMIAATKPAGPTRDAPEVHGAIVAPRVKWTCGGCKKRNDSALQPPLGVERVVCKFCRRMTKITIPPQPAAAPPEKLEERC